MAQTFQEMEQLHGSINVGIKEYFGRMQERMDAVPGLLGSTTLPQISPQFDLIFSERTFRSDTGIEELRAFQARPNEFENEGLLGPSDE
jgi:hypothetical protein